MGGRFLRPDMKVTDGGYGHRAIMSHQGVFWGCGRCGMKNAMGDAGCRMCGTPNYSQATLAKLR